MFNINIFYVLNTLSFCLFFALLVQCFVRTCVCRCENSTNKKIYSIIILKFILSNDFKEYNLLNIWRVELIDYFSVLFIFQMHPKDKFEVYLYLNSFISDQTVNYEQWATCCSFQTTYLVVNLISHQKRKFSFFLNKINKAYNFFSLSLICTIFVLVQFALNREFRQGQNNHVLLVFYWTQLLKIMIFFLFLKIKFFIKKYFFLLLLKRQLSDDHVVNLMNHLSICGLSFFFIFMD